MATIAGGAAKPNSIDAQFSATGGVLLQVSGVMLLKVGHADQDWMHKQLAGRGNSIGGRSRHVRPAGCAQGLERTFSQTFFLAVQEKGFFVLNDILRVFPPASANVFVAAPERQVRSAARARLVTRSCGAQR